MKKTMDNETEASERERERVPLATDHWLFVSPISNKIVCARHCVSHLIRLDFQRFHSLLCSKICVKLNTCARLVYLFTEHTINRNVCLRLSLSHSPYLDKYQMTQSIYLHTLNQQQYQSWAHTHLTNERIKNECAQSDVILNSFVHL